MTFPLLIGGAPSRYRINQSLRFRAGNSARLSRTGLTAGTANRWAVSFWAKLGAGSNQALFCGYSNGNNYTYFGTSASNQLTFTNANGGVIDVQFTTNAVYRDPTAWYHVAVLVDTTLTTASDRFQIWVNGTRVTSFFTNTNTLAQNTGLYWNDNFTQYIGTFDTATNYFDGYIAEFINTGRVATNPTVGSFGQTDATTGAWVPKRYTGTYGTNGFYLPFNDATSTTTISQDRSGNGNNWTSSGISVTSGVTFDQMLDTPTNSYATLNPTINGAPTPGNGNLSTGSSINQGNAATFTMTTGKWYWEVTCTGTVGGWPVIGCAQHSTPQVPALHSGGYGAATGTSVGSDGSVYNGAVGSVASFTTNDVIGFAFDADTGRLFVSKNGVWQNSGNPVAGTGQIGNLTGGFYTPTGSSYNGAAAHFNFGQRPFAYTPPTGFVALCTANLSSTAVTLSGSFTGNAAADGPVIWTNGNPATLTINGNAVTFGTHADKIAGGFKVRSSSASYNASGTNNWTATAGTRFRGTNGVPNNAQGNP